MPGLTVKVGRQVFNWGEGIFYRGNQHHQPDRRRQVPPAGLRTQGSTGAGGAISFNIGLTDNLSLESFSSTGWNWKGVGHRPGRCTFFSERLTCSPMGQHRLHPL